MSPAAPEGVEIWAKPLASGAVAAIVLNRSPYPAKNISIDFAVVGLPKAATTVVMVRDLWKRVNLGNATQGSFVSADILPSHGVLAVKLIPSTF